MSGLAKDRAVVVNPFAVLLWEHRPIEEDPNSKPMLSRISLAQLALRTS